MCIIGRFNKAHITYNIAWLQPLKSLWRGTWGIQLIQKIKNWKIEKLIFKENKKEKQLKPERPLNATAFVKRQP